MQADTSLELHLSPLPRGETPRVLHLALLPEQHRFVAPIEQMVGENDPSVDFHIGTVAGEPVAFFKIDRDYRSKVSTAPLDACGFEPDDLGLRGMLVGQQFQGRGYGKAVMARLKSYVSAHYQARHVFLMVNCLNHSAIHLYTKGGWEDTGQLYLGGRSGPQHIFRLTLF
ncbi:GNAT family N-acetyltransferase [Rhizobium sp.]|jgi:ribosomal protein S18 acetylase RimI-like enzyme|uniref:GNAT family N-acetyltransferase n=1 Tax=Rhizobium sp. TaxID=391 RepID=UPI000E9EB097|nr:hypothetical protein [Rhizobium sp.]